MQAENENVSPKPVAILAKTLHPTAIISEAWGLVYGIKADVAKRVLLIFAAVIGCYLVVGIAMAVLSMIAGIQSYAVSLVKFLGMLVTQSVGVYMSVPLIMIGIRRAINLPIDMIVIKAETHAARDELIKLIVCYVAFTGVAAVLLGVGGHSHSLATLILVLIYSIANVFISSAIFIFAIPLIITRKKDYRSAFFCGLDKVLQYWVAIFVSLLLYGVILVFTGLFIVTLVWLIPMGYVVYGILFRDICGLQKQAPASSGDGVTDESMD